MKYCLISYFILLHFCDANVPRPVKIAAIFDDNSDMRHDLMFVNAIKARGATYVSPKMSNNNDEKVYLINMINVALYRGSTNFLVYFIQA